jgi:hypothetical protein
MPQIVFQIQKVENWLTSVTIIGAGTASFTYDATGIRVKTVRPNGDTIYTPFPNYEEEVCGATTIKRRAMVWPTSPSPCASAATR